MQVETQSNMLIFIYKKLLYPSQFQLIVGCKVQLYKLNFMHRSTLMTCVSGRASATHVFPSFHVQLIKLTQKLLQLVSAGSASIFSDAQPSRQDNEYDDFYATQRYFTSNIEPFVSSFIGAKAYNQSALAHLHHSSRSTHGR